MLVDNRDEVREFLISRRAKITPPKPGCPSTANDGCQGLRRGEVAALAGVSVEYYAKLERGAIAGASASVLDAIARALQLDWSHPSQVKAPSSTRWMSQSRDMVRGCWRWKAFSICGSDIRATYQETWVTGPESYWGDRRSTSGAVR